MIQPTNEDLQEVINAVTILCKNYNCWIVWDASSPWEGYFEIDGNSHEEMADCAEALDRYMNVTEARRNV